MPGWPPARCWPRSRSADGLRKGEQAARIGRQLGTPVLIHQPSYSMLNGAARAGRQLLHVSVGHLQAAAASAITRAAVSVSFDGGKTWHRAAVTGHDGRYTATFGAPAGAKVSLRTSATDAAGGSVTETITSAYQIA